MLTQMPTIAVIIVYLLAALLPALFLMRYIYRKDTIEKEPRFIHRTVAFAAVFDCAKADIQRANNIARNTISTLT